MSLETKEDGEKYIKTVHKTLFYLCEVAREAGLNSHAGIFMIISAAFAGGVDDIKEVSDLLGEFNEKKLRSLYID